jgi:N-acyl homoserine lactone hydrolase
VKVQEETMRFNWTISPLLLATSVVDRSQGLLNRDPGTKVENGILAFLLRNGKEKILVDTGICGFEMSPRFAPFFTLAPDQTLEAQLRRFGTSLDEIALVINTHLHIDHCSGNVLLGNARFFVQRKELEYWRKPLRVHRQAYRVEVAEEKIEVLDGDREIAAGVTVMLTPGHSPGSQAVLVETSCGLYVLAGDSVPQFENMEVPLGEPFWPSGIYVNLKDYYESLDRLRDLGGVILPGHDLRVMGKETYP